MAIERCLLVDCWAPGCLETMNSDPDTLRQDSAYLKRPVDACQPRLLRFIVIFGTHRRILGGRQFSPLPLGCVKTYWTRIASPVSEVNTNSSA